MNIYYSMREIVYRCDDLDIYDYKWIFNDDKMPWKYPMVSGVAFGQRFVWIDRVTVFSTYPSMGQPSGWNEASEEESKLYYRYIKACKLMER